VYPALDCGCRRHHPTTLAAGASWHLHWVHHNLPGRTNRALPVQAVVNAHTHTHKWLLVTSTAARDKERPGARPRTGAPVIRAGSASSGPHIKGLVIIAAMDPWLVLFYFEVAAGMLALCYCLRRCILASREAATRAFLAQAKQCPCCGEGIVHYRGHGCHHIKPCGGCPRCGHHFCYVCLGDYRTCGCPFQGSTFCGTRGGVDCGCPPCPVCRPGQPCNQCCGDHTCPSCSGAGDATATLGAVHVRVAVA